MTRTHKNGKTLLESDSIPASKIEYSSTLIKAKPTSAKPVLITGGAGFIGTNAADSFMSSGTPVIIVDNLTRPGVSRNLEWLSSTHGSLLTVDESDVRNQHSIRQLVKKAGQVLHFAAQVAVTTSLDDPVADFEVNARGTLNVLESIRCLLERPPLVFTSTNKVYGSLDDVALETCNNRYEPVNRDIRYRGIDESRSVEFHSPYGCSKGAADQYVLDYARTFGLPAIVFRMSCIYGPHQCGNEDQGWIAHFLLKALAGEQITLYGDGKQVRDALFVDDLVTAFRAALRNIDQLSGQAFNIGGGPENSVSLLEVVDLIERYSEKSCSITFDGWRAADQRYYVSDTSRFEKATGWKQTTNVNEGIRKLHAWFRESGSVTLHSIHQVEKPIFSGAMGASR